MPTHTPPPVARRQVLLSVLTGLLLSYTAQGIGEKTQALFRSDFPKFHRLPSVSLVTPEETPSYIEDSFPDFECAISPFAFTPDWGAMRSEEQFHRTFSAMQPEEFIATPPYDMRILQTPLSELNEPPRTEEKDRTITAKLYYSTRYLGEYDLDSGEYISGSHPALDFKMPEGAHVQAIAGGRVHGVRNEPKGLGLYIILEHRIPQTQERVFSIYGHLKSAHIKEGMNVRSGQFIGTVGSSGNSNNPHLHLQIDRDRGLTAHERYVPPPNTPRSEIARWTMHPIEFINNY